MAVVMLSTLPMKLRKVELPVGKAAAAVTVLSRCDGGGGRATASSRWWPEPRRKQALRSGAEV
jgi:hypothetical protein